MPFHVEEHVEKGHLDLGEQFSLLGLVEQRFKTIRQLQGDIGILGGINEGLVDLHLIEPDLFLAAAGHLAEGDRAVTEQFGGEVVERVRFGRRIGEVGGDHGVELEPFQSQAGPAQDQGIVLDVLADLRLVRIFE